jgi:hypothetical protein
MKQLPVLEQLFRLLLVNVRQAGRISSQEMCAFWVVFRLKNVLPFFNFLFMGEKKWIL